MDVGDLRSEVYQLPACDAVLREYGEIADERW
jgi:hypothetical protein